MYGIGYLNPAFDDKQCASVTPKSSPVDVPLRSKKSSTKLERVKDRVADMNRAARRRLDMNSIPDVVQTSQPQIVQYADSSASQSPDRDPMSPDEDDEEFFLSKNSKLFSQVSTNSLVPMDTSRPPRCNQNPFHVVAVREMEIVKSIASPKSHVVLPSANVSVEQMPQVVERVEIIEDTETEPESVDGDSEDTTTKSQTKQLVPILKRKSLSAVPGKNSKKLTLRLAGDPPTREQLQPFHGRRRCALGSFNKPVAAGTAKNYVGPVSLRLTSSNNEVERMTVTTWKDSESVAEYLILGDKKPRTAATGNSKSLCNGARRKIAEKSTVTLKREVSVSKSYEIVGSIGSTATKNNGCSEASRRLRVCSADDDAVEDCESFYGSDKETDDALIFSDDTEIDVCSSSSSEDEESALRKHVEHLSDKVKPYAKDFFLSVVTIFHSAIAQSGVVRIGYLIMNLFADLLLFRLLCKFYGFF